MTQNNSSKIRRIIIYLIYLILSTGYLLTLNYYQYQEEYYVLIACYVISLLTYYVHIKDVVFDMFHPCHLFYFFYLCIFFYTPLLLIDAKEELLCGIVNVMGGCIPATIAVTLALVSYTIGYSTRLVKNTIPKFVLNAQLTDKSRRTVLLLSYGIYFFSCIVSLLYLFRNGKSLLSIILMGIIGSQDMTEYDSADAMLFLINISYLMLVPWLFICIYSRQKYVKIIVSFVLVAIFYAYGWRFIIYIMIMAYSIVYYRTKNKRPKLKSIAILGCFLLAISVYVGATRNSVRSGNSIEFSGFSKENIAYTLESNFNIYQTFYAIVDYYPQKADYYYGQACFVYPWIMWIPRSIWPQKPYGKDFPAGQALMKAVPEAIEIGAMSFPNLMEYYLDFGFVGVVVISFFIGLISKKMVSYYNSSSVFDIIVYSLFIGFLIQFINRGYIAQLVTLFVFLYLPLIFYKHCFKIKI